MTNSETGFFGRCEQGIEQAYAEADAAVDAEIQAGHYLSLFVKPHIWKKEIASFTAPLVVPMREARKSLSSLLTSTK